MKTTRVRSKICGITRPEDAIAAVEAGADAIGLVFYEPSPRYVTIERAKQICDSVPAFVSIVALFVDAEPEYIQKVCVELPVTLLQFHGSEEAEQCEGFGIPYIKAVSVRQRQDVLNAELAHPNAKGILVDTYKQGVAGGTGETFDWSILPDNCEKALILAGGLNPQNIRSAIEKVKPYAVDVSGGVETAKGIKSSQLINQFIQEVSSGNGSEY